MTKIITSLLFILGLTLMSLAQEATKSQIDSTAKPDTISSENDKVFTPIEEEPQFPGGETERIKFLVENIKYPPKALRKGIHGTVIVKFIVEKSGKITDISIVKGIGGGCDEEVIRVVELMPNWKPGKQRGKAVRAQFTMPVKFSIPKK